MVRRTPAISVVLSLAVLAIACGRGREAASASAAATRIEALHAAARSGDLDRLRGFVESGVAVDAEDRYNGTALLMAARAGQLEIARYLLEHGADPSHAETFFGSTPLDQALSGEHHELAALLLARGADDREGALEVAIERSLPELARAAVLGGPIHESRLAALRERAEELSPDLREILGRANSRPDPAPPAYSAQELERFAGRYEGWDRDTTVEVEAVGPNLSVSIDGAPPQVFATVGDRTFADGAREVELSFWGRWGTIEAAVLERGDSEPENLRLSVAEPVGADAFDAPAKPAVALTRTVNWPGFRGERAAGIGDGTDTPARWDVAAGESVRWGVEIPGLGNSSPVVWGDRVFLTTAVADSIPQEVRTGLSGSGEQVREDVVHTWRVLALDKWSGEKLWETEVGSAVPLTQRHFKASQANSTPVTDGRVIVAVFPTAGLACLDLDGHLLWKHELGGLNAGAPGDPGSEWGFASSPMLYGSSVILQVDVHGGAYLAAWDIGSGRLLWRTERDVAPSWATPNVLPGAGGDELIVNGSTIHGYDPATGRELWSLAPNSELVIATPVIGDGVAYVSAGYAPIKPIYAIRAGTRGALRVDPEAGDARLLWSQGRGGAYMPTPLLYRGLLYVVHHNGLIVAYDAQNGTAIYKSRFSRGGAFTGSPVVVNGKIYVPTEEGLMYVLEAGPEYRELAVNDFGEPLMATPAVSEGLLLVRTPTRLVAIGDGALGQAQP